MAGGVAGADGSSGCECYICVVCHVRALALLETGYIVGAVGWGGCSVPCYCLTGGTVLRV